MIIVPLYIQARLKRLGKCSNVCPIVLMWFNMILSLERDIFKSPINFTFPRFTIVVVLGNEVLCMIGMTARLQKNLANLFLWIYFLARIYFQYNQWDNDMFIVIVFHMICSDQIVRTIHFYLDLFKKQHEQKCNLMHQSFLHTLKIVPSGVLIINNKSQKINFVNPVLLEILGFKNEDQLPFFSDLNCLAENLKEIKEVSNY